LVVLLIGWGLARGQLAPWGVYREREKFTSVPAAGLITATLEMVETVSNASGNSKVVLPQNCTMVAVCEVNKCLYRTGVIYGLSITGRFCYLAMRDANSIPAYLLLIHTQHADTTRGSPARIVPKALCSEPWRFPFNQTVVT
jgi:hypothetical protein